MLFITGAQDNVGPPELYAVFSLLVIPRALRTMQDRQTSSNFDLCYLLQGAQDNVGPPELYVVLSLLFITGLRTILARLNSTQFYFAIYYRA